MQIPRQGNKTDHSKNLVHYWRIFTINKVNYAWFLTFFLSLDASTFRRVKGACSVILFKGACALKCRCALVHGNRVINSKLWFDISQVYNLEVEIFAIAWFSARTIHLKWWNPCYFWCALKHAMNDKWFGFFKLKMYSDYSYLFHLKLLEGVLLVLFVVPLNS